jgi:hypothetical protein
MWSPLVHMHAAREAALPTGFTRGSCFNPPLLQMANPPQPIHPPRPLRDQGNSRLRVAVGQITHFPFYPLSSTEPTVFQVARRSFSLFSSGHAYARCRLNLYAFLTSRTCGAVRELQQVCRLQTLFLRWLAVLPSKKHSPCM